MATVTCTGAGCGAELGPADMMCSSCGTPRPRARRDRQRSLTPEGGHRPVPGPRAQPNAASDGAGTESDCDHRDNEPGAIICARCAVPLNDASEPSAAVARRYRIEAPWGDFLLDDPETDVGRNVGPFTNQLRGHPTVSRRHATLRITTSGRLHVIDQGSANGTLKNGRRIDPNVAVELRDGDTVSFSTMLTFGVRAEEAGS